MAPENKPIIKSQISAIMEVTQQSWADLKKEVGEMKAKLDELYFALIGGRLAKDGGLIKRVLDAESQLETMQEQIRVIERKNIKSSTYLYIVWCAVGFIASSVFLYVLNLAFKK